MRSAWRTHKTFAVKVRRSPPGADKRALDGAAHHGINESATSSVFSSAARVQELAKNSPDLSQQITVLKALRHDVEAVESNWKSEDPTAHESSLPKLWSEIDIESAKAP